MDVEAFDVDLREDVERGLRLDGGDAGNLVEHVVDADALVVHAAARHDVVVDALVAIDSICTYPRRPFDHLSTSAARCFTQRSYKNYLEMYTELKEKKRY